MLLLVSTLLALLSPVTGWILCGVEAATFNDWHTANQASLSTSEYKIDPIPNSFCSAFVAATDVDCQVAQIGMLVKWFFALECTKKCNQDNCMEDHSGLAVTCQFDEADNAVNKATQDLLWSASCTCPAGSTHSGSQKEIMLASMSQMKRVYDQHSCSAESGSEVAKLSVCSKANGKNLQEWIDSHPGSNFASSGFNLTQIPNLLCSIAAETKAENCDSTTSLLPQWYFSQKCMEKCHDGRCADFAEMHLNCYSVPANNEDNNLDGFTMSAQCVCPECTVNSGAIKVIESTSLQEMLAEYRRLMCPDPTALIQTAALACNSAEAARIIDEADSCGDGPVPFCDKYAECVTDVNGTETCQCKEGYTGSGYDCIKLCEVEAIDNAASYQSSSGVNITVGDGMEETESMTVSCSARSRLIGDPVVECGCGGFVDLPACKPECASPKAVPNGVFVHLDSSVPTFPVLAGTVLTLNCSAGYLFAGSDPETECLEDGTFNTTGFSCDIQSTFCESVSPPSYPRMSDNSTCLVWAKISSTWTDTFGHCQNLGMELALFETQAENELMANLMTANGLSLDPTLCWWIAYKKENTSPNINNEFKAYSTPDILSANISDISLSSLSSSQPTALPMYHTTEGDCAVISPDSSQTTLIGKMTHCTQSSHMICSKDLRGP